MQRNMNWTEPQPPTAGASNYTHVTCETPLGRAIIEWKGWKDDDSYVVSIQNNYIGSEYSLQDAKDLVKRHLLEIQKQLLDFLAN